MKILWIVNHLFVEANNILLGNQQDLSASGGWMIGAANALLQCENVALYVAAPSSLVKELKFIKGEKITYCAIPQRKVGLKYVSEYEAYWQEIEAQINPDVVEIHGTEFTHGLAYVNACGNKKVVVSIQGMRSVIAEFFTYGLSYKDVILNMTLHDIFRGSIYKEQRLYKSFGKYEIDLLKKVNHIIGRTMWDRAHIWAINPTAQYHFCNRILRDSFYSGCWNYSDCQKYTIFLSQGSKVIKGFHQLLKAMPLILREFPETVVYIAGPDPTNTTTIKQKLRLRMYGRYLKKLISQCGLENHIHYVGPLNEKEMKFAYLSCNVFLAPSSIENESNSLAEAQLLGVPCVAAYSGGMPDSIINEQCGFLYRFEDVEMLAYYICQSFNKSMVFDNSAMCEFAQKRHDKKLNTETLLKIYHSIINAN